MKSILHISVRDLVGYALQSGDLDLTAFGTVRPVEAIFVHTRIQDSRPREYTREVPVSYNFDSGKYTLAIGGRIDGVYQYADRVIIDEIKTTKKDIKSIEHAENKLHWGQAKCYAYMYAKLHDLAQIEIQLTYFHMETSETKEIRRSFGLNELKEFFHGIVARYVQWADMIYQWHCLRDDSIRKISFPFSKFRAGQEQMMKEVSYSLEQEGQLLIQAPTGIGKTIAVLFPAVKAICNDAIGKIFYLTARSTGRSAAETSLNLLRTKGLRLKSLSLTAKDKICFNPDKLCNGTECKYARGYYDRIPVALKQAFELDEFKRDDIISVAQEQQICPFEFSLDLSIWVDCIICDYNYVFDPRVYLKRFFREGENNFSFLVDEAHNLVDRSREMFSAAIQKAPIVNLRDNLKDRLPEISKSLDKTVSWIEQMERGYEGEHYPIAEQKLPDDLCDILSVFTIIAEKWLRRNESTDFREDLLQLYFDAKCFLKISEWYDETYATCYLRADNDISIKLFCIDPSHHLRGALERCRSSIFFSATLRPMSFFIQLFGCDENAQTLVLPSPFESEKLCTLIMHKISVLYKFREFTKHSVAKAISLFIGKKKGNYLVFYPSYDYMKMVYDVFKSSYPDNDMLIQSAGMSEPEREHFLQEFNQEPTETLVGFVVLGGVFAESIDLIGERLTGAVIVGVGLPGLSLDRELIKHYFDHQDGNGFAYAYQYPGMIKVLQAAGRVIRSEKDRGAILLVDTRYTQAPYCDLLPGEWQVNYIDNVVDISDAIDKWGGFEE